MNERFRDRREAGRALAQLVRALHLPDPLVLALPRGGVPVALEVARALDAPLDLLLVRKIGLPWQPELAVAAVVEGDPQDVVVDEEVRADAGIDRAYIEAEARRQLQEIARRRALYRAGRAPADVAGRSAIVVDDGIATGTTMRAALKALRRRRPAALVLAVPVAAPQTMHELAGEVDHAVCVRQPAWLRAIGLHYDDFHQLEDDEVLALLASYRHDGPGGGRHGAPDA